MQAVGASAHQGKVQFDPARSFPATSLEGHQVRYKYQVRYARRTFIDHFDISNTFALSKRNFILLARLANEISEVCLSPTMN